MILRHLTTQDFIQSIMKDGFLRGSNNLRGIHNGHVSFELFNSKKDEKVFIKGFAKAKGISENTVVQLLFDGTKMIENGIEVRDAFITGSTDRKIELGYYLNESELESVGDYRYVFGNVPLKFLIESPKTF
ncbi:hypothetical protein ABE132_14485 [Peribacillus simplex]|uniref:hypothetical protein n=1 Tax=Peribacillus simplex TaxID=1478 RepID=UPI003D279F41